MAEICRKGIAKNIVKKIFSASYKFCYRIYKKTNTGVFS